MSVGVAVGELLAVGVGVGSSDSAGTPSTAAKTAALAIAVTRILRVKGEDGPGLFRLPPGVGTVNGTLEPWAWGSDPIDT